jgi:hypothetical protein
MDEELFELNTIIGEDDFDESIEGDEEEDEDEDEEGFKEDDDDEEADSLDPEAE